MSELPTAETLSPTERTSLVSRLLNIYATPGDVFQEVKGSPPSTANWLVPVILMIVAGLTAVVVLFSQETIVQEMRRQQARAIDQQVEEGKISPEQAEMFQRRMEGFGPRFAMIGGAIGTIVSSFATVFWWAFIIWLIGRRAFKAPFPFSKAIEVAGLSTMIYVLGTLISMLLGLFLGRLISGPSLALFVDEFDPLNKLHLLLGAINLIYLWYAVVLGIGLAILAESSVGKALAWIFGFWVALRAILILAGAGSVVL